MSREARRAELLTMLSYMRPNRSKHESKFIARFLKPLKVNMDMFGNLHKVIPNADGSPSPILWSCHTDTVHRSSSRQQVFVSSDEYAFTRSGECLGADCTTGVWIMMNMIRNKIPGHYIFHRDEEVGCLGSGWIRDKNPGILKNIKFAIAFDRKGIDSIITRQSGGQCCSAAFADSLNQALGNKFKHDPTGTVTDTAKYTRIVPECTNISVGYYSQHTSGEIQDLVFADWLLETILEADFSGLVCERDPTKVEVYGGYRGYGRYSDFGYSDEDDESIYDRWRKGYGGHQQQQQRQLPAPAKPKPQNTIKTQTRVRPAASNVLSKVDQLKDLCFEHPDAIADFLDTMGITPNEIREYIWGSSAAA